MSTLNPFLVFEKTRSQVLTLVNEKLTGAGFRTVQTHNLRPAWPILNASLSIGGAAPKFRLELLHLPHSYHWMTGVIGGVLGFIVGWIWYRWRGDVI